jgi:hypothetical protein
MLSRSRSRLLSGDRTSRRARAEEGSIAVAMTVMLVLSNLSVAVLARALVSLSQVRRSQDFVGALPVADGGLSDALFRLDQATPPTLTGTGAVGSGSFKYVATRLEADRYLVQVKGTVGKSAHAIEATVTRRERFPYALFSNQGLTFNGQGTSNIYSVNAAGGAHTGQARVGSNRAIVINSGAGGGDYQDYYSPAGSCIGCPNPVLQPGPYRIEPVVMPSGPTQACPPAGVFAGAVNGLAGVPYVCDQNASFVGTVTVINPPAVVYIAANRTLTMSDAVVNQGGAGADLQIFKAGTGALDVGNGAHAAHVTAVLNAPQTELVINGGEAWLGSVVVNSVKFNGAPNYTLAYDGRLTSVLTQDWRVSHWHEVPSTSVGF